MTGEVKSFQPHRPGRLQLQDGAVFYGLMFGKEVAVSGETVFQTGMVGYPESLTDPSYKRQLLVLTFPLIGNYGVPDRQVKDQWGLPQYFESHCIHAAALIVSEYSLTFSHYLARDSLHDWLLQEGVPGICGIDTRRLTKHLREKGTTLGRLSVANELEPNVWHELAWDNPNESNLVAEVSVSAVRHYPVQLDPTVPHVAVLDCGLKYNQLRCLLSRGVQLTVLPWNCDVLAWEEQQRAANKVPPFDALFVSNGPGDPETLRSSTVASVKRWLTSGRPLMGICLGHQLLAEAIGCRTYKMKYGNRGHNQPCLHTATQRCFITTQNHGYCVDATTIPKEWQALFYNLNDDTNEGLIHERLPFFSVQFHPEHCAGPQDLELLFDVFVEHVRDFKASKNDLTLNERLTGKLTYIPKEFESQLQSYSKKGSPMAPMKVLLLGSGGLRIGQAGEFDYSGSQALKALKEEGVQTVLINPNIATVQTTTGMADCIYMLPLDVDSVKRVIDAERPDGILLSFGGQTGLNCGLELAKAGILEAYNVTVLGTQLNSIEVTEDRRLFSEEMERIGEEVAPSGAAVTVEEALQVANRLGYPVMLRAAYTLGGLGSGFAETPEQLRELATAAFQWTKQVLVDKSLRGWKEVEYEVVRDAYNNCITVCNMENFDPVGIHTGDSIVVAPSQTLSNADYQRLRTAAIKVISHLRIVGECNIQFAVDPHSHNYYIIEVNARLSRSSALASKATGYPLAYIAAKLSLGRALHELRNSVTRDTTACFEPSLDYCVVKVPRWDLSKFSRVSKAIGSCMKSVGEVMGIGRNFEEALQKALRMTDDKVRGLDPFKKSPEEDKLVNPTDRRVFFLASALYADWSVTRLHQLTSIDMWFLRKLENIISIYKELKLKPQSLNKMSMLRAKRMGFSDRQIAECTTSSEMTVRELRLQWNVVPFVRQVDTVAAEFPAHTNYLYCTYWADDHDVSFEDKHVMVLGSGVYRIGSSVEFDWCGVDCIRELRRLQFPTIMVNCNPETVSTDYDMCDRLYFEEITLERVLDIYQVENPRGVVISMGGQLPNNIAMPLYRQNVRILGTSAESIDNAENRYKFSRMLDRIGISQPQWKELSTLEDAREFCQKVGFPCLVRPSYVLSGAAMNVAYDEADLQEFLTQAAAVSSEHPVVISKFILEAKEIDVDAVACKGQVIAMAVSEHVENAGVHSGDASLVTPPQDLNATTLEKISHICLAIAKELEVTGPFNMQLIAKNNELSVIECNVRVSRSFPFVSKTLGFGFIATATHAIMDCEVEVPTQPLLLGQDRVGVKVPVFSFSRLRGADVLLGVEMCSTGEVACFGHTREEAYLKAQMSTGFNLPHKNILVTIGSFKHKKELVESMRTLKQLGYELFASIGTADFYQEKGIPMTPLDWVPEDADPQHRNANEKDRHPRISDLLTENKIDLLISLAMRSTWYRCSSTFVTHGYRTRRMAVDYGIPVLSDVKCVKLFVTALAHCQFRAETTGGPQFSPDFTMLDSLTSQRIVRLPGGLVDVHVHAREPGHEHKEDWISVTKAALAGGVTTILAMPNTNPPLIDTATFEVVSSRAASKAYCDYGLYVGATATNWNLWRDPTKNSFLANVVALKMYLNDTFSELRLDNFADWMKHFELFPRDKLICCHAEGNTLASVLMLAQLNQRSVHICHVARREEIELIRLAKLQGVSVTCEVAPHHLLLTEKDVPENWREVRPRLGTVEDVEALWQNLDVIDCFATDHAPHTRDEKAGKCGKVPPGFPGVETMLPLLLTQIRKRRLTFEALVDRLCVNPRRIFGLPPPAADTWIEVDLQASWKIPAFGESFGYSKAAWSPFAGTSVCGKLRRVVLRGEVVCVNGKVFGKPGQGQRLLTTPATQAPRAGYTVDKYNKALEQQQLPQRRVSTARHPSGALEHRPGQPVALATEERAMGTAVKPLPTAGRSRYVSGHSGFVETSAVSGVLVGRPSRTSRGPSISEDGSLVKEASTEIPHIVPGSTQFSYWHSDISGRSLLSVCSVQKPLLNHLFGIALDFKMSVVNNKPVDTLCRGKVLALLFFEPSTRTSCSFAAAMQRLGGTVISLQDKENSSLSKGESLADTVRIMSGYADCVVIRHPGKGILQQLVPFSKRPIINAGDGVGEHPTQALLDVFTIREEFGTVHNLTITLAGDLHNGRTVHSLARLLCQYRVRRLRYVCPHPELDMPRDVKEYVAEFGIPQETVHSLADAIPDSDVLYMTRLQKERFVGPAGDLCQKAFDEFVLTPELMRRAKTKMIVMHPLPRVNEICPSVDSDPRAAYFRQAEHGMYVRMALLASLMSN